MEAVYLPNSQADFQTQLTIIDKRLERARKKRVGQDYKAFFPINLRHNI